MGLSGEGPSEGGLICGEGGLCACHKKVNERMQIVRQNENLSSEKIKKMIRALTH